MKLPILGYHAVLPVDRAQKIRGTVPLAVFRDQVRWLVRRGFAAISLDQALDLLEGKGPRVERPIVFTFDDGYRCVLKNALPVLEDAGFTATLFVVTGSVAQTSDWYVRKGGQPFEHASWDELAEVSERGFAVGSHSVEHRRLSELPSATVNAELQRSREEITLRLGRCDHFSYPFGDASPSLLQAVERCGYRSAATTHSGFNRRGERLFELRRQMISRGTGQARFRRKAGLWW